MRRRAFKLDWPAGLGVLFAIVLGAVVAMHRNSALRPLGILSSRSPSHIWRGGLPTLALYIAAINCSRVDDVRRIDLGVRRRRY